MAGCKSFRETNSAVDDKRRISLSGESFITSRVALRTVKTLIPLILGGYPYAFEKDMIFNSGSKNTFCIICARLLTEINMASISPAFNFSRD